jgi:hypothetical protein
MHQSLSQKIKRFLPTLLVALMAIACNWLWPIDVTIIDQSNRFPFDQSEISVDDRTQSTAGWPWTYRSVFRYSDANRVGLPSELSDEVFDGIRLVGNILFWTALLFFTFWYTGPKRVADENGQPTVVPRRLGLGDLLILITLIAFALGYYNWSRKTHEEQEALRVEIERSAGWVDITRSIPWPIQRIAEGRFDDWLVSWNRISGVTIDNPKKELLEKIVALPHLEVLRLAGDRYPLEGLKPLERRYALRELRISGRTLDDETVRLVGRLKSLQNINLMRTNIHRSGLEAWGSMPRLRLLNLIHTDVAIDGDQRVPALANLYALLLPHPPREKTLTHRIAGLPDLQQLTCMEYDERMNNEPIRLIVEDCSALRKITLDTAQKLDLELRRLPVLESVQNDSFLIGERVHRRSIVPNGVWVRRAVFQDLPALTKMPLFIRNLEEISVSNCKSSAMSLSSLGDVFSIEKRGIVPVSDLIKNRIDYDLVRARIASEDSEDDEGSWLIPSSNDTQQMIDALANFPDLDRLSLRYRHLSKVDLSVLSKYQSLKTIDLAWAKITKKQLGALALVPSLEKLRFLSLEDINRSEDPNMSFFAYSMFRSRDERGRSPDQMIDMNDVLTVLPNLRVLDGDSLVGQKIELEGHQHIESLTGGDWTLSSEVALKNNPKLRDTIVVGPALERLQIRSTPELRGIVMSSPWPRDGVVEDCSQLQSLAVGGRTLQDNSWRSLGDLGSLQSLTVAHSALSAEELQRIGQAKKLRALGVSGSAVDDTVVKAWGSIRDLEMLDLREIQITADSLEWIRSQSSLKYLAIDLPVLQGASRDTLEFLNRLQRLTLRGGTLDAVDLKQWPSMPSLREWRLEQVEVTADGAAALSEREIGTLQFFDLDRCTIDLESSIGWLKKCVDGRVVCSIHDTVIDADVEELIERSKLAGRTSIHPFTDLTTPGYEGVESFGEPGTDTFMFRTGSIAKPEGSPWSSGKAFLADPELYRNRNPMLEALP